VSQFRSKPKHGRASVYKPWPDDGEFVEVEFGRFVFLRPGDECPICAAEDHPHFVEVEAGDLVQVLDSLEREEAASDKATPSDASTCVEASRHERS
jgi:hypothetical protein